MTKWSKCTVHGDPRRPGIFQFTPQDYLKPDEAQAGEGSFVPPTPRPSGDLVESCVADYFWIGWDAHGSPRAAIVLYAP